MFNEYPTTDHKKNKNANHKTNSSTKKKKKKVASASTQIKEISCYKYCDNNNNCNLCLIITWMMS